MKTIQTHTTKHTPGPWHIQPIGSKRYVEAQGPKFICDMQIDECSTELETREAEANARLIASAPELLEALAGLFDEMQSRFDYVDATPEEQAALNKAEAALARSPYYK